MLLNISNIQHFSTGDGNGIRTTVFFKGCNLKCPWCHDPENLIFEPCFMNYKNLNKTEVKGKLVQVKEVILELLEDKDFYDNSGGGVTLSGGEVMLQTAGAVELSKRLKEQGVDVIIDTAGSVSYNNFQKLNPYVKGYLYDIKTVDINKIKEIGGDLTLIIENLKNLLHDKVYVQVRVPLIPNFNTDKASIENICKTLNELNIERVELLPFHNLGSGKYQALGLEYKYENIKPLTSQEINEIVKIFNQSNIKTVI